ncbi:uncharacterized protein B0J16DRAFT_374666 [Fusarium flagelliforme]|uniref:uncharacterized protein n=1 Tax=Fusarium flagelliforme TaxID=2675880 RepID=UPI001E8CFBE9|nr:uncharacterized protein B0J16DRAFT_374666 [Fusarium flagelliforme]KAH7179657.1 hypothetical protein B0J16DRAFT_374666 [Fusarium flagelliforme]
MAGGRKTSTKKDPENQNPQRDTTGNVTRTLEPGWRPGRDPANIEINLGVRRSQRIRARNEEESFQESTCTAELSYGNASTDNKVHRPDEQQASTSSSSGVVSQTSSGAHAPSARVQRPVPPDWEPPLIIGASLGENLSRMEIAERSVLQWEAIIANTRRTQPRADLSGLEKERDKARQEFEQMEESDENLIPVDELESTKRQRIQKRINLLTASLERNECPTGDTNIRAAINAYRTEQIRCWDKWTLLYAGHLADSCPSYESFTHDREERLDRYYSQYGEGWLWYEPPLAPRGSNQTEQLMAATWAQPSAESGPLTEHRPFSWNISMGFQRVMGFHSRETRSLHKPGHKKNGKVLLYPTKLREFGRDETDRCFVEDDEDDETGAPRVCFKMLLDSGATHPSLHGTDLQYLGIDKKTYPAQTHISISTADSSSAVARVYEMRIDVCRHNGESLVGDDPVFPNERRQLGGIAPVMVLVQYTDDESEPLSEWYEKALKNGEDVSEEAMAKRSKGGVESRLSGMIPFQVCYFAGAPGKSGFWFGEDRRDILGADRMPGQRRWELHLPAKGAKRPEEVEHLDRPTVIFEHKGRDFKLLDADSREDSSTSLLTIEDGVRTRQMTMKVSNKPGKLVVMKAPKSKRKVEAVSPTANSGTRKKRQKC